VVAIWEEKKEKKNQEIRRVPHKKGVILEACTVSVGCCEEREEEESVKGKYFPLKPYILYFIQFLKRVPCLSAVFSVARFHVWWPLSGRRRRRRNKEGVILITRYRVCWPL
jgi:hypothetical protein